MIDRNMLTQHHVTILQNSVPSVRLLEKVPGCAIATGHFMTDRDTARGEQEPAFAEVSWKYFELKGEPKNLMSITTEHHCIVVYGFCDE